MDLEPDYGRLASLAALQREERSAAWWIAVIIVGVLIGNVLSYGAYKLYIRWEMHQIALAAEEAMRVQTARIKAQSEQMAKENAARAKERQRQLAVNQQLRQTCEYWKEQLRQENTSQNRAYRDAACARAAGAFQ
jgi:hypothetical protein